MSKGEKKSRPEMDEKKKSSGYLLDQLKALDIRLTNKLGLSANENSPWGHLRPHMKMLEMSCHGIPWLGGCTIMLWITSDRDSKAFWCNLYIALFLDIVCVGIIKALTRRRRPAANNMDMFMTVSVDKLSFPSGHVTRAILVTSIFCHQFGLSAFSSVLLHTWCIAVSISRVLLGRHHVGDVIGGVVIGWCLYWVMSTMWLSTDAAIGLLKLFMNSEFNDDSGV